MYNRGEAFIAIQSEGKVDTYATLNEIVVKLIRDISDIRQNAISSQDFDDITNNDMHVIEAIGVAEPKNMSTIAKELSVTVGTLTIAMNSLVKKGYVIRERGETDRRIVYISLSELGRAAYDQHANFHKEMIDAATCQLEPEEMEVLLKAVTKLNNWFRSRQKD